MKIKINEIEKQKQPRVGQKKQILGFEKNVKIGPETQGWQK